MISKLCVFAVILALSGFAQSTIRENIQFTTVNGDSYDLYEELDKGKFVFVTFIKIFF